MDVIASFEHSIEIELALKKLEESGIGKDDILAIPLDEQIEGISLFDTIDYADGVSLMDVGFILGCIFMLLGAIYGFVLAWGPVIWGLIGLIVGTCTGVLIKYIYIKRQLKRKFPKGRKSTEVFLAIRCNQQQYETVKKILLQHFPLGIGKIH